MILPAPIMKLKLLFLAAAVFWTGGPVAFAKTPAKLNVILILADDFGFEAVGANGGQSYKTPNLDRLAATGMRFENCHVQPLCTPTRMQLMTGLYNVRNYEKFGFMDPASKTFANVFHDAGYTTAIVGKWQLGQDLSLPKRWGFDEYCLWQLMRRPERYRNPGLEINGREVNYTNAEYGPDLVNQYALDFITRNKEQPFLLYYPMILTHDPFVPTPDSADYNDEKVKRTGRDAHYFGGMASYADKMVGRIVAKLDELKLRENTLILFLGDNGTSPSVTSQFRGLPYQGGKGLRTRNGTHVPLIANLPKTIPAGSVNPNLVDSTDFLVTICDAAGLTLPKAMTTDGQSFWPQLQGKQGLPRQWSYCWYSRNGDLQFEFAQDLNFKLYRDGNFVAVISDHEEQPLTTELTAEAAKAKTELGKVLAQYSKVRPANLKKFEPVGTQDKAKRKKRLAREDE